MSVLGGLSQTSLGASPLRSRPDPRSPSCCQVAGKVAPVIGAPLSACSDPGRARDAFPPVGAADHGGGMRGRLGLEYLQADVSGGYRRLG